MTTSTDSSDSEIATEKRSAGEPIIKVIKSGSKYSVCIGNKLIVLTEQHSIVKKYLEIEAMLQKNG